MYVSLFQIKIACRFGLQVRAVGSGHSWSSVFPDEGDILLSMGNFKTLESGSPAELDGVCCRSGIASVNETCYFVG